MNSGAFHLSGKRETKTQVLISMHQWSPGLDSPRREHNCSISFKLKGFSMLSCVKLKMTKMLVDILLNMQILERPMWAACANEVTDGKSAMLRPPAGVHT